MTSKLQALHDRQAEADLAGRGPPLLAAVNVDMTFGNVHALSRVNLHVTQGEWVAIVGSSGSGKSTLLQLFAGLDEPTNGAIFYRGVDLARYRHLDRYRRVEVGLVFQLHNLLPHLDALRNVEIAMFGTLRHRASRLRRAETLLDLVQLSEQANRTPPEMSGGERQRVAIARALANDPAVILADEPTGSLDPKSVEHVMEAFARLNREGHTIVMVTHDREAAARATRIVRLESGELTTEARHAARH